MKIEITFHSFQAKKSFIKVNAFSQAEIISETAGSIVINNASGYNFEKSAYVYSVKETNK